MPTLNAVAVVMAAAAEPSPAVSDVTVICRAGSAAGRHFDVVGDDVGVRRPDTSSVQVTSFGWWPTGTRGSCPLRRKQSASSRWP